MKKITIIAILSFFIISCGVMPAVQQKDSLLNDIKKSSIESPLVVQIRKAEIAITDTNVTSTIAEMLAEIKDSPVKELKLRFDLGNKTMGEGKVKMKILGKEYLLNFSMEGDMVAVEDNKIRFTPTKVKVSNISVGALMQFLGIELEKIIKLKDPNGRFYLQGNSFFFVTDKLSQDPLIRGKLVKVGTEKGIMVLYFN